MPYIPPDIVAKAREMDLLTYLQNYEPQELVHFGGNTYCTREHDSLKISDGKWCWDADPFQVTDETKVMVVDNICYMLNNFINCSAYENVIFCWVMHEQSIIDSIMKRLNTSNCDVKCISLIADEKHLRDRLSIDVENGIRTADVVARSVARIPLYSVLNTIKINTNGKTVSMIADEIKRWGK